jgi:ferredoxin-NADP reductase
MERLSNIQQAESKVLADVSEFLQEVQRLSEDTKSLHKGINRLRQIRSTVYENLNQIQHEHFILQGLHWLQENGYDGENLEWYWNPRQTGDANEPDLMAKDNAEVVLCAEATTSEKPVGGIDSRMRDTLAKLNRMQGRKFYFVRTQAMAERARTKVAKNSWSIEVIQIEANAANPRTQPTRFGVLAGG